MWRVKFFKTRLARGLASRLDWVASSSCEVTKRPVVLFCPVELQLAWRFNFWHAWHVSSFWRLAVVSYPRDLVASLCFSCTLLSISSHYLTLPLQESHLNTGLLIAKIQANLAWNKANKMVDKIQPYNLLFWLFRDKTLKQTLDLTCELVTVEHNSLTLNSRNCEALESYEHESPETQQYIMIIVCRKAWNAYEAGMMWSSKDGVKKQTMPWPKKQSLQGSDHNVHSHLEWTLGHTS